MACSILAGQNSIGMILPLLHFGTEEQRQRFLPEVAKGRTLTSVCMSEPHCGSDVAAMKTKAVRDGIILRYQRREMLHYLRQRRALGVAVCAHLRGPRRRWHQRVPGRHQDAWTSRSDATNAKWASVAFPTSSCSSKTCGCRPRTGSARKARASRPACISSISIVPTVAAAAIGIGQGALDASIAYAKERNAFGKPIASFPGPAVDDRGHGDAARGCSRAAVRMHPAGRYGRFQPAFDDGLDGQMLRQRRRHEGRRPTRCRFSAASAISRTIRSSG